MSRWSGFHRKTLEERRKAIRDHAGIDLPALFGKQGLPMDRAEAFIENVVGVLPLPLGVLPGIVVDGRTYVVPMAVEESSVIAAASHGARIAEQGGGFHTQVDDPILTGQLELLGGTRVEAKFEAHRDAWMAYWQKHVDSMVKRGGGIRGLELRAVANFHVLHIHLDCRDAMGANAINTLLETVAPEVAEALGVEVGLRILSNLSVHRLATATARIPVDALGGRKVAEAIVRANRFATLDPFRAATHNKGIMNGIDPVLLATGNDWRAVEAGAHAYAVQDGAYRALTTYQVVDDQLEAKLTLPLAVGIVGGVTRLHPTVAEALTLLGVKSSKELAAVIVSVGLAQNLSALKALATEGIQRGHMALHARNVALRAGVPADALDAVATAMVADGTVTEKRALEHWKARTDEA